MSFFGNLPKKGDETSTINADTTIKSDVSVWRTDVSIGASQIEANSVCSTFAVVDIPIHPMFLGAKVNQSTSKALQRDVVDKTRHRVDVSTEEAKKCVSIVDVANLIPAARKALLKKNVLESAKLKKKFTGKASVNNADTNFNSHPHFPDSEHSIQFLDGDKRTLHSASTCGSLLECSTATFSNHSTDARTELPINRKISVLPPALHRNRNSADDQDDSDIRHSTSAPENEEFLFNNGTAKILKSTDYDNGGKGEDLNEKDEHGYIGSKTAEKKVRSSIASSSEAETKVSGTVLDPSSRRSSRQADLAISISKNLRRLREDSSPEDNEDFNSGAF